jgi:hypothetical protein
MDLIWSWYEGWERVLSHAHWMIVPVMPRERVAPLGYYISKRRNILDIRQLTIGITLQERVEDLQMA